MAAMLLHVVHERLQVTVLSPVASALAPSYLTLQ
jgi:hypothetical protein